MPVYGLTGGIASGKSTVADLLRSKGAVVIDADAVARELVAPGQPALAEIASRFGPSVVAPDATLDRGALGRVIFSDEAARRDLNAILHPKIFEAIRDRLAEIDPSTPVFVEAALLAETYSQAAERLSFAGMVVVDAPVDLQVARLLDKGLTEEEARLRLAAQTTRQARLGRATHVIDNSGSHDQLGREVDRVWSALRLSAVGGREVIDLYKKLLQAWNARDAAGFASLFMPDGSCVGFDGSQMDSREKIEAELAAIFMSHPTAAYLAKVREIRPLGTLAWLLRAVAGMVPPEGNELNPAVNTVQSLVAVEQDEGLRIALFQNTPAQLHGRPDLSEALTQELTEVLRAGEVVRG